MTSKQHNIQNDEDNDGRSSSASRKNSKSMTQGQKMFDENGKRIRYDKNGNQITTVIGTFSVANRKNLINKKKNAMSSDGTGATD